MKIFKTGQYTWWQVGLLKLSLLSLGIVIGASWPEVFEPLSTVLIFTAIILGGYAGYAWIKQ